MTKKDREEIRKIVRGEIKKEREREIFMEIARASVCDYWSSDEEILKKIKERNAKT